MQELANDPVTVCSGIPDLNLFFGNSGFNLKRQPGRRTYATPRLRTKLSVMLSGAKHLQYPLETGDYRSFASLRMTGDGLCHTSLSLEYGLYMLADLFGVRAQILDQMSRA